MIAETLLERLRRLEKSTVSRGTQDLSLGVRSVMKHLEKMLNTRQGSAPIADDYGMPDMTNFPGEDLTAAADELQEIIKKVIHKYEPRLEKVHILFEPRPGETSLLRFKLEGSTTDDRSGSLPVVLETVITADGAVRVEE